MMMRSAILAIALLASPALAQHDDMAGMAGEQHHVATAQEAADNLALQTVFEQVRKRSPGEQTRAIWADLRDAGNAQKSGKRAAFNRAIKAANAKLAAPVQAAPPLPPIAALLRARTRYNDAHTKAMRDLSDIRDKTKRPIYKQTVATTAALALAQKGVACLPASCVTPAQIAKGAADLDKGTTALEGLMRKPR